MYRMQVVALYLGLRLSHAEYKCNEMGFGVSSSLASADENTCRNVDYYYVSKGGLGWNEGKVDNSARMPTGESTIPLTVFFWTSGFLLALDELSLHFVVDLIVFDATYRDIGSLSLSFSVRSMNALAVRCGTRKRPGTWRPLSWGTCACGAGRWRAGAGTCTAARTATSARSPTFAGLKWKESPPWTTEHGMASHFE